MKFPKNLRAKRVTTPLLAMSVALSLVNLDGNTAQAQVSFNYDSTKLSQIQVNGTNLLTGNGAYVIGSGNGFDDPETNLHSYGAPSKNLRSNRGDVGAPYTLQFWKKSTYVLGFKASVGPADRDYAEMNLPFDFNKQAITHWRVSASRVFYQCTGQDGWRNINSGSFSSIPTGCPLPGGGFVGVAKTRQRTTWGEASGPSVQVRINITSSSHYVSLNAINHPGTNNLSLDFAPLRRGERANVEGELVIVPLSFSGLTFEAERDFYHQIGRAEGNGWSVRSFDPNAFLCYGPYTNAVQAGNRSATWRILLDNVTADNNRILTLDVYDANSGRVLAVRDLTRRQFRSPNVYQDFVLNFMASAGQNLEFRSYYRGSSYARIDKVTVR